MKRKHLWILALIIGLGLFFRFYMIKQMPGGLFPDEAAEGLDAQNINKGFIQPFYARGNGREGLFYFLIAPVIRLLGSGYWQLHLVSASIGILSVLAVYLLASKLYDQKTGLLASFLMAVGTWHIVLSRTAFRANLIPLFLAMTMYFIVRVVKAGSRKDLIWSAIFAGAFFAGGFYTYIAYRIIVAILGFIAFFLFIADARQKFVWTRRFSKPILIGLISFLSVFAPLGYYFVTHPGSFVGRSSQVSIFNSDLNHGHLGATLIDVTKKSFLAYFTHGDANWRHNISGAPFLSPIVSPFFGLALLVLSLFTLRFLWQCLRRIPKISDLKHVLIVGMFWGMLVPVITTAEGIPHGLRSIGTVPATYILAAIGLLYFAHLTMKVWHYGWMEKLYWGVAALYFAVLIVVAYSQYFVYAKNSSENYYSFRADLSVVSDYLNAHPQKEKNFLVLDLFSEQTPQFLTESTNRPYIIVDPANSYKLHLQSGDRVIFTHSTLFDITKFQASHRNFKIVEYKDNTIGDTDMIVYQAQSTDNQPSFSINADKSFWALNLGDKIYWSWENQSFRPWTIKIWQCSDINCGQQTLVKQNDQNDYFANNDYINIDGTKSNLYYKATAFNQNGSQLKDFGVIKINQYK